MATDSDLTDQQLRTLQQRAQERHGVHTAGGLQRVDFEAVIAEMQRHAPVWTEADEREHQRLERKKLCSAAYRRCNIKIPRECRFGSSWLAQRVRPELRDAFRAWLPCHGNRLVSMAMSEGKGLVIGALFGRIYANIISGSIPVRFVELRYATVAEIVTRRQESDLGLGPLRDWLYCSTLVIDELGKNRDNANRDLWTVVDTRYRYDRATIGLSGHPVDKRSRLRGETLTNIYGAEFVKRLCDPNKGGKVIEVR